MAPGLTVGFPWISTSAVMNSIARRVYTAFATVSACSWVPTCDSTTASAVLVEVNLLTSAPAFPPGTVHSSSPFLALPVISALPVVSQPPTSTELAGLREVHPGRKGVGAPPKVYAQYSG